MLLAQNPPNVSEVVSVAVLEVVCMCFGAGLPNFKPCRRTKTSLQKNKWINTQMSEPLGYYMYM